MTSNEKKVNSKQLCSMNNFIESKINKDNIDFFWKNINTSDEGILRNLNNMFTESYQIKLNLISVLLNSNESLPITTKKDLIKLFNTVSPLNIEYNMANSKWNYKIIDNKLFIQNSISKKDSNEIFYKKYINLLKKILVQSKIDFNYFEFKLKRFNKSKDIVWVFDLKQFIT